MNDDEVPAPVSPAPAGTSSRSRGRFRAFGGASAPAPERRRVRVVLAAIMGPIVVATLVGLVVLWPGKSSLVGSQ
ncbi:hypothetical protein LVA97_32390, partial [Klebsiella pneumoniae]